MANGLNGYIKPLAVALGFFLGGFSTAYLMHTGGPVMSWVVGGFASLAPYLVGLASKDPRRNEN